MLDFILKALMTIPKIIGLTDSADSKHEEVSSLKRCID